MRAESGSALLRESKLHTVFLVSECSRSGACMDGNAFGTYTTDANGSVYLHYSRRVIPSFVHCPTAKALDRFIGDTLMAVAEHARRKLVVTASDAKHHHYNATSRSTVALVEYQSEIFAGIRVPEPPIGAIFSSGLPYNVVMLRDCLPEEFGRLDYEGHHFALTIYGQEYMRVLEVVSELSYSRQPVLVSSKGQ